MLGGVRDRRSGRAAPWHLRRYDAAPTPHASRGWRTAATTVATQPACRTTADSENCNRQRQIQAARVGRAWRERPWHDGTRRHECARAQQDRRPRACRACATCQLAHRATGPSSNLAAHHPVVCADRARLRPAPRRRVYSRGGRASARRKAPSIRSRRRSPEAFVGPRDGDASDCGMFWLPHSECIYSRYGTTIFASYLELAMLSRLWVAAWRRCAGCNQIPHSRANACIAQVGVHAQKKKWVRTPTISSPHA